MQKARKTSVYMGKRKGTNDKYEKFASLIVEGKDAVTAMLEVYPSRKKWNKNSRAVQAHKLLNNPNIILILARMREKVQEEMELTKEDAVRPLQCALQVTPIDYYDDDGNVKPEKEWTKEMRYAFQEYAYTRDGSIIGVKLYDRVRVAERLSKMMGWDKPEEKKIINEVSIADALVDSLADELKQKAEQNGVKVDADSIGADGLPVNWDEI